MHMNNCNSFSSVYNKKILFRQLIPIETNSLEGENVIIPTYSSSEKLFSIVRYDTELNKYLVLLQGFMSIFKYILNF